MTTPNQQTAPAASPTPAASTAPAIIPMTPVDSSQLDSVGYHEPSKTMAVRFKRGASTYHYANVTPEQHKALIEAPSVGSHFYKNIRPFPEKHPFTKIEDPAATPKS